MLAPAAVACEDQLVDLAPLGRRARLTRPSLERAHHAPLDDALQAVHAERLGAEQGHALVAPRAGSAYQLVVGGAKTLTVQVVYSAESIQNHAPRGDAALRRDGQHLMDPRPELRVDHHLAQHAAHCSIELERCARQPLAGGYRDREGVDVQLGGGRRDQADLHGSLRA